MPRQFDLSTFEIFRDNPESAFYASVGRSPEETWVEIVAGMDRALARAVELTLSRRQITPEWIGSAHAVIFESTFPDDAGRFRGFLPSGDPEEVFFGITVGTSRTARVRQQKGSHPRRIVENLDRACLEFDNAANDIRRGESVSTLRTATTACARLYAKVANIHPFVDGNLRAAYLALQAALLSIDLPLVQFPELDDHDVAIDTALRVDGAQSYAPLATLIEEIVKTAV